MANPSMTSAANTAEPQNTSTSTSSTKIKTHEVIYSDSSLWTAHVLFLTAVVIGVFLVFIAPGPRTCDAVKALAQKGK